VKPAELASGMSNPNMNAEGEPLDNAFALIERHPSDTTSPFKESRTNFRGSSFNTTQRLWLTGSPTISDGLFVCGSTCVYA
jgi:hypothetical protein